jgi:hypothetical protein
MPLNGAEYVWKIYDFGQGLGEFLGFLRRPFLR